MPLAHRVIPVLLHDGEKYVKGERFNPWRVIGHIEQAAQIYARRGADEMILLDVTATPQGRKPNLKLIEKIARDFFTPLTVGGGVTSVDDVRDLLRAGADKVAIGTAAWEQEGFIGECAAKFGRQAIVAAVDHGAWGFAVRCGARKIHARATTAARRYFMEGAGEILLTSIPREGTMSGYDTEMIAEVAAMVDVPLIANGGCGTPEHMVEAINAGAAAVAAGAMFAFGDVTPRQCCQVLKMNDLEVRL